MRSEEARIGAKVMVGEADGRTLLFWHYELEQINASGA